VVFIAVLKMDMTELIFVIPGMKINGQYYHDVYCLSRCCQRSSMLQVISPQQDNAPSHRASTPLNCYSKKRWTSLVLISGNQTAQTWIQWIIKSGCYAAESVWMSYEQCRWAEAVPHWGLEQSVAERYWRSHQRLEKATESMRACRQTTFLTSIVSTCD